MREDGTTDRVAARDLLWQEPRDGHWLMAHRSLEGWRLGLAAPTPPAWEPVLPRRASHVDARDRIGIGPALGVLAAAAALLWAAHSWFVDWAVPLVPDAFADAVGREVVASFAQEGGHCAGAAGQQALEQLAARLFPPGTLEEPVTLHVLDVDAVNAFAAPGGHVALFRGLIDSAGSPDVVAGVLAHELGHVKERHALRGLVRAVGVGLLVQSVGGNAGTYADLFLTLSRSREYERQADADAVAALARINVSPAPLAAFFDTLDRKGTPATPAGRALDDLFTYVSTHPDAGERRAAILAAAQPGRRHAPALSAGEWAAVTAMCDAPARRDAAAGTTARAGGTAP